MVWAQALNRVCLILPLALLPALMSCGQPAASGPVPLAPKALAVVAQDVADKDGVDREALARVVDALFTDPAIPETRALIVMHNGRMIAERYSAPYHEHTRLISWSMAKSVTGVMIGMLVSDGRLRLNEPAPVPAWQRPGDPRGEITLRQLLQMRSGLHHVEAGDPPYKSDEVRMLFLDGRDDMAKYAESQPLETRPGTKFEYSTATSVILADLAARSLAPGGDAETRRRAVADYLRTRLFEPMGTHSMLPEFDAAGTLIGGSTIHATPRDWARFGEMLRNKGAVRGVQLVPRQWIDFMTTPSPREAEYGAQIWLNRKPTSGGEGALFRGKGAASAFSAIGHLGQYVIVSPEQGLVVVRLGKTQEDRLHQVAERLGDVVALFPKG